MQLCVEEAGIAVRLEKVSVYPDLGLQERRQEGMWKLPYNCLDLTRKQSTLDGRPYIATAEKIGGVPNTRTISIEQAVQKRKREITLPTFDG